MNNIFSTLVLSFVLLQSVAKATDQQLQNEPLLPKQLIELGPLTDWEENKLVVETIKAMRLVNNDQGNARRTFEPCAKRGSHQAMHSLGNLYKNSNITHAIEWNLLAFKVQWMKHGTHYQECIIFLNELVSQGKKTKKGRDTSNLWEVDSFLKKYKSVYQPNKNETARVQIATQLFQDNSRSSHLTLIFLASLLKKPNYLKWLAIGYDDANTLGKALGKNTKLELAKRCYEQMKTPEGYGALASLYVRDEFKLPLSDQERLQYALAFYEKPNLPRAQYRQAKLLIDGYKGCFDNTRTKEERLQKAKILLEQSDTPDGRVELALLYTQGLITDGLSERETIQRAETLLKSAGTEIAAFDLAFLYVKKRLGEDLSGLERANTIHTILARSNKISFKIVQLASLCNYNKDYEDFECAAQLYRIANTGEAKIELSNLYLSGKIEKSLLPNARHQKAAELFKDKDCLHNNEAKLLLAEFLIEGYIEQKLSQQKRDDKAKVILEKLPIPVAFCDLGSLNMVGRINRNMPQEKRDSIALSYFQKSGIPLALYGQAFLYEENRVGQTLTKLERYEKAAELYEKSKTPEALNNLGNLYRLDKIGLKLPLEERTKKAEIFFIQSSVPEAKCNLGWMYHKQKIGQDLSDTQRYEKAVQLYEESGTPDAVNGLACLYSEAKIITKFSEQERIQKAFELFKKAGTTEAKFNIAQLYLLDKIGDNLSEIEREEIAKSYLIEAHSLGSKSAKSLLNFIEEEAKQKSILEQAHMKDKKSEEQTDQVNDFTLSTQPQNSKKERKEQKSIRKTKRNQQEIFQQTHLANGDVGKSAINSFSLTFESEKVETAFHELNHSSKKVIEIFKELMAKPWGVDGIGRPEYLKGNLKGYYSRRINEKDRLVYNVNTEKKTIHIFSCQGHYFDS